MLIVLYLNNTMANKTININPILFNRTTKNKERKSKPIPLISPNILKNKLLKRIKDHKNRETQNLEKNANKKIEPKINLNTHLNTDNYDEFENSINYFESLSKQKNIQQQKENLQRKTLKTYTSPNLNINLELPEELKEPLQFKPEIININPNLQTNGIITNGIKLNYKVDNVNPWGILKQGIKPTYRDWNKTQRNLVLPTNNEVSNNLINNERENKLQLLKERIKQKQNISSKLQNLDSEPHYIEQKSYFEQKPQLEQKPYIEQKPQLENKIEEPIKKIVKTVIHHKYTLGKSKIKKTVSILLKNKGTRKKILNAYKDLKKVSINDIKKYLKEHNLIKIGSNAPHDVIRKLYESCILAGDITNSNKDILVHNFIKDDNL